MKQTKKTSIIWTTPVSEFKDIIRNSTSYREAIKKFGFQPKGGNLLTLKNE